MNQMDLNFDIIPLQSRLRPFDSYPATFYALPKVHKVPLTEELDYFTINTDNTNIPMRPINSCIGSPCVFGPNIRVFSLRNFKTFSVLIKIALQ